MPGPAPLPPREPAAGPPAAGAWPPRPGAAAPRAALRGKSPPAVGATLPPGISTLPPPYRRGAAIDEFEESGTASDGSAFGKLPALPAEDGFENRRDTAFVITGSGGASSGAGLSSAGAGPAGGGEPNGLMRADQPGPEDLPVDGRVKGRRPMMNRPTSATTAAADCTFSFSFTLVA